jgi:hypothetical protein
MILAVLCEGICDDPRGKAGDRIMRTPVALPPLRGALAGSLSFTVAIALSALSVPP